MKRLLLIISLTSYYFFASAQWTTKTDLPAIGKNHPVTFSIDGIGYAFTGYNTNSSQIYSSGYKYDPQSDSWTQLSNFPAGARGFAAGASYNGKGYLGFGTNGVSYLDDLWEYDPATDSWIELSSCPCLGRRHPAFVITTNGKIYVGLGDGNGSTGSFNSGFSDWWEYDIATDSWTQQPDLPASGRHHPYYFAIGEDAYTGFGHKSSTIFNDFYKFSSSTGNWTILNNFPGEGRVAGAQFDYDGFGYIVDGEGSDHQNLDEGEFYKYNPISDTWQTLASHSGDGLWAPGAFVIDSMVYLVGGDLDNDFSLSTLWAYSLEDNPVDNALTNADSAVLSHNFFDESASFQWVDCNDNYALLPGETGSSIELTDGDSYALVVQYSEGGIDTSNCYSKIVPSTGLELQFNRYFVYPNPSRDFIYLKGIKSSEGPLNYTIFNSVGKEVLAGKLKNMQQPISIENVSEGLYFLFLESKDESVRSVVRLEKIK